MNARRLAQLLLFVAIILCSQIAPAQTEVSLLDTIHRTANELSVFPIDVVLDNSTEVYSQWDLRYDVTYSQFRLLYLTLLTAELATKGEALECLQSLEDMTPKERALALAALYVYDRNHTSPFNLNVVERFYPDRKVTLAESFSESERLHFIEALQCYCSSNEDCFVKRKNATLQDWEDDFRKQVLLFQSIMRFTGHATAVRGIPLFYRNFLIQNTSLRFLYALLVLETINDELPVYKLSSDCYTLPTRMLKEELSSPSEIVSPRELLNDLFKKSQSDVLECASNTEAFFEVIIMREFLKTQFAYTRLHGTDQKIGLCDDSSSNQLELGTIAQQILEAINLDKEGLAKERIVSVEEVTTVENMSTKQENESFLTFVRHIAPNLTFFNPSLVINRPEKICAPNQPELYVMIDDILYYDYEIIYNLRYSVYYPFYMFCKRVENATDLELQNAFDCLDELNAKEKSLVLTALSYYVVHYESTDANGKNVCPIDKDHLTNVLKTYQDSKDALFKLPELDKDEWEKNYRNDILFLQALLGAYNPFIRMGCDLEELTQVCEETSCRFLYALAAWEIYCNLDTDSLPPIDDNVIAQATEFKERLQDFNQTIDLLLVNDNNQDDAKTLLSYERQIQMDVMREYLLTQFSCSRRADKFPSVTGASEGNVPHYPLTLGGIAQALLRSFENEEVKRDITRRYRELKLQEDQQFRQFYWNHNNQP